jgi:hypothetical protein
VIDIIDELNAILTPVVRFKRSAVLGAISIRTHDVELAADPVPGKPYIIAIGAAQSPREWCGGNASPHEIPSVFDMIPENHLEQLKLGVAYLLIDQTHEGYQTVWLWDWFHDNCTQHGIAPRQVIYVTGNLEAKLQYDAWLLSTSVQDRMLVCSFPIFELDMWFANPNPPIPVLSQHVAYKTSHPVKLFNALQRRPRNHRMWLFYNLVSRGLLSDGIVSMNAFTQLRSFCEGRVLSNDQYAIVAELLPIYPPDVRANTDFSSTDCGTYLSNFNTQVLLDTWMSVISEASFADSENTCFLSEKTFKMIRARHPFIIFGNKGSLRHLRAMGYKTFSPFIDESYDDYSTWDRLDAIMQELTRLNAIPDKLAWFESMREILVHNYNTMYSNSTGSIATLARTIKHHIYSDQ